MALNGVRQIKTVTLRYCMRGGSSRGMREFILSETRQKIEADSPFMQFKEEHRPGRHPLVIAEYVDGYRMQIDARKADAEDVHGKVKHVMNRRPGHIRTWGEKHRVVSRRPSIQGPWHPDQWLGVHVLKDE